MTNCGKNLLDGVSWMQIKSLFVGKLQHQTVMVTRNDYSENVFFSEISAIGCCKARQSQERYFASNAAFKASKYGRTFVNFVGEAKLANCNGYM